MTFVVVGSTAIRGGRLSTAQPKVIRVARLLGEVQYEGVGIVATSCSGSMPVDSLRCSCSRLLA
jgi:hypothetical protein